MPRLFSGIEIPVSVAQRLTFLRAGLSGARWIDPENYHLTLRFLGDVDGVVARDFTHGLADIVASPFELKLGDLASFGGRKPRAVFASVSPSEPRNYTPHVTVARLRGASSEAVAAYLERQGGFMSLPFEVSRFVLFSSPNSVGGGPYVVEAAYPLEG